MTTDDPYFYPGLSSHTTSRYIAVSSNRFARGDGALEAQSRLLAFGGDLRHHIVYRLPEGATHAVVDDFGALRWRWAEGADRSGTVEVVIRRGLVSPARSIPEEGMGKADFNKKASKWIARLMNTLLAKGIPAAVYDPLEYVPGDEVAMENTSLETLDSGHPLYVESQREPDALWIKLGVGDMKIDVPANCVFGTMHVIPDASQGRIQLAGICTPFFSAKDLDDLSKNIQGSLLVRARDACDRAGVRMTIRQTRRRNSSLTVEFDLSIDDLKYKADPDTGEGWQRPFQQVADFAETLGKVSNALQGPGAVKSGGGCYIATAVYGSYDAPEVLVLRQFRDEYLSKSVFGRSLIRTYYRASPRLADHLRTHPMVNRPVRVVLDRVVARVR
jgi:hypothetical protein